MSAPVRRKIEAGIYERLAANGRRLGLEVVFKDAAGSTRRRAVKGTLQDARDALAAARTRRVKRTAEPADPRVTFNAVADEFERAHVASLRLNSRQVYTGALTRLRATFGNRRLSSITKLDVRAFVASLRAEGLKANTISAHLWTLSALYSFARDDLDMPVSMPKLKPSERPRAEDDAREHRVLSDDELGRLLDAIPGRSRLYFRTLAETGARRSEVLGLTGHRIGDGVVTFAEQASADGKLAPLKTRQSRRTVEVTRGLAAELRLAGGRERVFGPLARHAIEQDWATALRGANLAEPQPVIHDLRHTHVSGLIADGWDPREIADRIGDTLATTLAVYSHAFDTKRRGAERRGRLEARYGAEMATDTPRQSATDALGARGEVADLQAIRNRAQ